VPKTTPEHEEMYRAIGRYMVEFSSLVLHMRYTMSSRLKRADDPPELIELAFGEAPAQGIANSFFAFCRATARPAFDTEEEAIERNLRKRVLDEIPRRNDIAHGDWLLIKAGSRSEPFIKPELAHTKPARKQGSLTSQSYSPAALDEISNQLSDLTSCIWVFGLICTMEGEMRAREGREPVRVRDRLRLVKGNAEWIRPTWANTPQS
jgi:hypothetical protein